MLFKRVPVISMFGGLPARSRQSIGEVANIEVATVATDANMPMTVEQMAGGAVMYSGLTAGRQVTTPTAALILAAATDMDVGDSFAFTVSCTPAFAVTWVAGTGVTLAGRATTPASSSSYIVVTKTSATAVTWTVL